MPGIPSIPGRLVSSPSGPSEPNADGPGGTLTNIPLIRPRNFAQDMARHQKEYSTGEAAFSVGSQGLSTDTVGNPLPSFGNSGTRVKIQQFHESNQLGKPYGISIKPDIIREGKDQTDAQLLEELKTALRELGLTVFITDAVRGSLAKYGASGSRHKRGKALDIGLVNGRTASLQNPDCIKLAKWLIAHGYTPGSESGSSRALLLGPVGTKWNKTSYDHTTHLHISIA